MLSITIPTYNEKENLPILIEKINYILKQNKINGEIIVVDDNSPDGTGKLAEDLKKKYENMKVLHRAGKLGLSSAVLDGFKIAEGDIMVVIDADLSHPPEVIPLMYNEIQKGTDFVIGSRYIKGGKIIGWSLYRRFISKGANLISRPFSKANDSMSGYIMIKKECLDNQNFNPKGFKIALEFLVKAKYNKLKELPITFTERRNGKSKAGPKEYYSLLRNLYGYLQYKNRFRYLK
ncbi:MAG: polyprenol monophosphomannose synthase [Nanoarchaeota archaeon]|nr:polyprenol monophosphomannose synthase [Nanoarchaeota archaeon]